MLYELFGSTTIPVGILDIRLLQNAVEIFMEAVKDEGKELLGVVLRISTELGREALEGRLELTWCKAVVGGVPELVQNDAKDFGDGAAHT